MSSVADLSELVDLGFTRLSTGLGGVKPPSVGRKGEVPERGSKSPSMGRSPRAWVEVPKRGSKSPSVGRSPRVWVEAPERGSKPPSVGRKGVAPERKHT
jgi:hypothetical protein